MTNGDQPAQLRISQIPIVGLDRVNRGVSSDEIHMMTELQEFQGRFDPTAIQTFSAAFFLENAAVSFLNWASHDDRPPPQVGYNPFKDEPPEFWARYSGYRSNFQRSQSPRETQQIASRVDTEMHQRMILANSGPLGFFTVVAAAASSPEILIPFARVARLALRGRQAIGGAERVATLKGRELTPARIKGGGGALRRGGGKIPLRAAVTVTSALDGMLAIGAAGAVAASAAEIALQSTQETRTAAESLVQIIGATILTGLFGGVVAGMSARRFASLASDIGEEVVHGSRGQALIGKIDSERLVGVRGNRAGQRFRREINRAAPEAAEFKPFPIAPWLLRHGLRGFPIGRVVTSEMGLLRVIGRSIASNVYLKKQPGDAEVAIEDLFELDLAEVSLTLNQLERHLDAYGEVQKIGKHPNFLLEQAGMAMAHGDKAPSGLGIHETAAVEKLARTGRQYVDRGINAADRAGLVTKQELTLRTGSTTHFPGVWNRKAVELDESGFIDMAVEEWTELYGGEEELSEITDVEYRREAKEAARKIQRHPTGVEAHGFHGIHERLKDITLPISFQRGEKFFEMNLMEILPAYAQMFTQIRFAERLAPFVGEELRELPRLYDEALRVFERTGDADPLRRLSEQVHDLTAATNFFISGEVSKAERVLALNDAAAPLRVERDEAVTKSAPLKAQSQALTTRIKEATREFKTDLKAKEKELTKLAGKHEIERAESGRITITAPEKPRGELAGIDKKLETPATYGKGVRKVLREELREVVGPDEPIGSARPKDVLREITTVGRDPKGFPKTSAAVRSTKAFKDLFRERLRVRARIAFLKNELQSSTSGAMAAAVSRKAKVDSQIEGLAKGLEESLAGFAAVDGELRGLRKEAGISPSPPKIENDSNVAPSVIRNLAMVRRKNAMAGVNAVFETPAGTGWLLKKLIDAEMKIVNAITDPNPTKQLRKRNTKKRQLDREIGDMQFHANVILARLSSKFDGFFLSASKEIGKLLLVTKMGGVAISSIPDVAGPTFVRGIAPHMEVLQTIMADSLSDLHLYVTRPRKVVERMENRDRLSAMFAAYELTSAGTWNRMMRMADMWDPTQREGPFGRATTKMAFNFMRWSTLPMTNAWYRNLIGFISQNETIKTIEAMMTGGKVDKVQAQALEIMGINRADLPDLWAQIKKHRTKYKGKLWLANTDQWDNEAFDLRELYEAALFHENRRTLLQPGAADTPKMLKDVEMRRHIFRWKQFALTATHKIFFSGLQRMDAAAALGSILMAGAGAMVYAISQILAGRDISDDPAVWAREAVDRSGLVGIFTDLNNMLERASMHRIGIGPALGLSPASRYSARNLVDATLGPTFGLLESGRQAAIAPFRAEGFNAGDIRRLRDFLPYNQLFYLRTILDKAETGVIDTFGFPEP